MLAISISRAARSSLLATRRTFTSVNLASIKELRAKTSAPVSDCKKALDASDGDIDGAFDWLRQRGAAKASDLEKSGREANEGLVAVFAPNDHEAAIVQAACETDFVPRNDTFQAFLHKVASIALYKRVPPPPASGVYDVNMKALLNLPLEDGISQNATSVGDALVDLVVKIRENMSLVKSARVAAIPGIVGSYVHGGVNVDKYPGLGKVAAVVTVGFHRGDNSIYVPSEDVVTKVLRPLAKKLAMHIVAAKPKYIDVFDIPGDILDRERELLRKQALESGKTVDIAEKIVDGRIKKYLAAATLLGQSHLVEPESPPVSEVLRTASQQAGVELKVDGFVLYSAIGR